ncbi:MAG: GAF domain-containing protein [Armatimonadetes bacterium]|nr:GAF domain-containing protein [Armatimonadota bacterium]
MIDEKTRLIENLTGVRSSKLNYYVELKKRNREIVIQNRRLEIIHQLGRDINIDMSLEMILKRVYENLPLVISCDFLGLVMLEGSELRLVATQPPMPGGGLMVPRNSLLWETIRNQQEQVYLCIAGDGEFLDQLHLREYELCCLIANPLRVKQNIIGMLVIGTRESDAYSRNDLNFARQLADQLAICIQNRRLYEEVVQAKREWEETFRALADPLLLTDLDYNVLLDNGRYVDSIDSPEQTGGKKCFRYLWGREQKCEHCLLDEVCATGKPAYRRMQTGTGKVLDVFYYPVFNDQGRIYGVIHHLKDVTASVHMQAKLIQSAKLAAIGEMAAGVAHELNSPLTVIIGNAQILQREPGTEHQASRLLKDIVACGLRCKKIIQNLLTFARQEPSAVAPTDLNEVVERVLSLIKYQINLNGISVYTDLARDLPRVAANGQQLDQVLINLLLNARDALEGLKRERYIRISTGVRKSKDGRFYVTAAVEDNGRGISPENLSRVFDPFFTTKEASLGTGLGLSVSLGIAQAHGGTIEVESRPGEGSTFTLVLPLGEDQL